MIEQAKFTYSALGKNFGKQKKKKKLKIKEKNKLLFKRLPNQKI